MTSASVMTIEELSGPGRRIELVGPGLPLRGADWPVEQRIITTWYPGNGEATQHVLGHMERPSEWDGVWNTTRLLSTPCKFYPSRGSSGQSVVNAFTLYRLVESFEIAARSLAVTWSAGVGMGIEERTIRRIGRIANFVPSFDRADDIRWKITFDWSGRGQGTQPVAPARGEDLLAGLAALKKVMGDIATSIELARIKSASSRIPNSASFFSLGDLEQLAATPTNVLNDLSRAARQIESQADQAGSVVARVRQTPDALREQAYSIARGAEVTMTRFEQSIGVLPIETFSSDDSRVGSALKGALYVNESSANAGHGAKVAGDTSRSSSRRGNAIEFDDKGRRVKSSDVQQIHIAKKGETFASISMKYFGSTSRAGDIAKANGFPMYQVSPPVGTSLVIPAFDSPDSLNAA